MHDWGLVQPQHRRTRAAARAVNEAVDGSLSLGVITLETHQTKSILKKQKKDLYLKHLEAAFSTQKNAKKGIEISAQVRQSSLWWKEVLSHCMSQTTWKCGKVPLVVDELVEELRLEQAEF